MLTARIKLRFGPGRTCELLARVLDRAIQRAEKAGVDPRSLTVIEATVQAEEDVIRVRRKGYGTADWIRSPVSSVRILLGPAGTPSITSTAPDQQAVRDPDQFARPTSRPLAGVADQREPAVREALSEVVDPDLGVNIVDLGFVRAITFEGQTAVITITLTSAACPLTAIIEKQIRGSLAGLSCADGGFRIDWQWIPAWQPADITDSGRDQLRAIGFTI